MNLSNDFCCFICNLKLKRHFIYCVECKQQQQNHEFNCYICLECFSNGIEYKQHKPYHSYKVINMESILTFNGWTLHDELKLINFIEENKCNLNEALAKLANRQQTSNNNSNNSSCLLDQKSNQRRLLSQYRQFNTANFTRHVEKWYSLAGCCKTQLPTHHSSPYSSSMMINRNKNVLKMSGMALSNETNGSTSDDLLLNNPLTTTTTNATSNMTIATAAGSTNSCPLNSYPTRPVMNSSQYKMMSGYRPARADFEAEYKDKFESKHISDLDFETHQQHDDNDTEQIYGDISAATATAATAAAVDDDDKDEDDKVSDSALEWRLKFALLNSYRDLIAERYERKRFIKEFGLINELGLLSTFQNNVIAGTQSINIINSKIYQNESATSMLLPRKYDKILSSYDQQRRENTFHLKNNQFTNWTQMLKLSVKFHKLFKSAEDCIKFNELACYQYQLRKRLEDLKEYRANGLTSLRHVSVYTTLKQKRLNRQQTVHLSSLLTALNRNYDYDVTSKNFLIQQMQNKEICRDWFKKFVIVEKNLTDICATSYSAARTLKNQQNPLRIEDYPDVEKLDEDEKEFCRVARVQPTVYLRVKAILLLENSKAGCCPYSRARKIAGIDVNKTRQIHTHMISQNLIRNKSLNE